MGLIQKDMINSLSKLLDWLEQENSWGTNRGELKFITGRIGELYTAIMTNGEMAIETNQKGYDVVSEIGERISVKSTTSNKGTHHFTFNNSTLDNVDRVIIVYVDVEEVTVQIIYDELIEDARKLMIDGLDEKKIISQSKILKKNSIQNKEIIVLKEVTFNSYIVKKLESGSIKIVKGNQEITPVKPTLRKIANEIGVSIVNSNGNDKTTRGLGNDVISQLSN